MTLEDLKSLILTLDRLEQEELFIWLDDILEV